MRSKKLFSIIIFPGLGYLFYRAGEEFWLQIRYTLSPRLQVLFSIALLGVMIAALFAVLLFVWPDWARKRIGKVLHWRNKLRAGRWVLFLLSIVFVIFLLQYSKYGNILSGSAIHYSFGLVLVGVGGFLLSKEQEIIAYGALLLASLVVFSLLSAAVDFVAVTSYPFSLGWSEGNRLFDYSVLFGRRLYDYPQDQVIFAHIDFGRQLVGGIPYIFDGVSIWVGRAWWALTVTLLYALFGWVLFRRVGEKGKTLVLLSLWVYLFINQGPIHPPLVVCAILVGLAWGRSYWVAVPLLVLSGYFAQLSRFTWIFAPAMWILMLEFSENKVSKTLNKSWLRSVVLTLAGLTGSLILPTVITNLTGFGDNASDSVSGLVEGALGQGLLWYRLLPSATFSQGVLPGLLQAIIPILIVLGFLLVAGRWQLNIWQKIVLGGLLMIFLVVGLIVSTKIGGGGDLHNLDMLLIGLVFAVAIAWRDGGRDLFAEAESAAVLLQVVMLVLVVLPGLRFLGGMKPLEQRATEEEAELALDFIREKTGIALEDGQVLFMDQRQLLTFGYVEAPLIVDYEKKYLIDQALSGNEAFFQQYYQHLAEGYFDLIVTEPLHTGRRGSEEYFGEENDAWVTWVSAPTLCFYEEAVAPDYMRDSIGVVLLIPKEDTSECANYLHSVSRDE
jgi:hypothetical protein